MAFHDRKEEKSEPKLKKVQSEKPTGYNQDQVQEINQKVDGKISRVEENLFQWIDEEAKSIKSTLEKDLLAFRSEVDTKHIDLNSKVQSSIHDFKEEINEKVAIIDNKINDNMFEGNDNEQIIDTEESTGASKAILELKNKLHRNCNTLRFLCSEPLSIQYSVWNKGETKIPRENSEEQILFNWVNCNVGGAVEDGQYDKIAFIQIFL